ncbi:MAG: hypothetical protein COB46_09415 [Rhodospirillaceae bacterium]|nr:MAG: hypothetical protein COB46_09415 [Rhodospirillaceae bacterium]
MSSSGECFDDHREQTRVQHSLSDLLAQRITGIALGYEDLNDHDTLRHDPLLKLAATPKTKTWSCSNTISSGVHTWAD